MVSGKVLGEQVRRMLQAVPELLRMRNSSRKWLADNVVMSGVKNADGGQCCKKFCVVSLWLLLLLFQNDSSVNCRIGSMWGNPELGQLCGASPSMGI